MNHFTQRLYLFIMSLLVLWTFKSFPNRKDGHVTSSAGVLIVMGQRIGGRDELVEGCFNRFDDQASIVLGRDNINNLRCQAFCTEQGYALAATSGCTCFCGNDYPGLTHRVETSQCNNPCNPDKASCDLFTCCGNANGTLFTVGWSGEIDPMKQILRKLTYDYRRRNPTFRRKIETYEGIFCNTVTLRLADNSNDKDETHGDLYLSVGDGCPVGWACFADGCYHSHWAEPSTYEEAVSRCHSQKEDGGAELVTICSESENRFVKEQYGGCQGWINMKSTYASHTNGPLQLAPDGSWVHVPYVNEKGELQRTSCFICKKARGPPCPAVRPHQAEEWYIDVVDGNTRGTDAPCAYPWCKDCSEAYLQNQKSHQYLCVDAQNYLYLSWQRDPNWCLLTLVVDYHTGAVVILTRHNSGLYYDSQKGMLIVQNLPGSLTIPPQESKSKYHLHYKVANDYSWEKAIFTLDGIAVWEMNKWPFSLVAKYLRISVFSINRRDAQLGMRECSMALYDATPSSQSFTCRYRQRPRGRRRIPPSDRIWPNEEQDLIVFVQSALLVSDQSSYYTAREPLPNGRLTCLNRSPTETATCLLAYGQAVVLIRRFRVNFGLVIFDTVTDIKQLTVQQGLTFRYPGFGAAGGGGGGGGGGGTSRTNSLQFVNRATKQIQNSLTAFYNTFYQIIRIRAIVETHNWQLGINVTPMTALILQFWLTTHYLYYRWRAIFQARGSFCISIFGRPIGQFHSLGDLSEPDELIFHMFGIFEEPVEAALTLTDIERVERSYWGLPLMEKSIKDEQRPARRSEFLSP